MTLQFIEWLRRHLDQGSSPGCVWVDKKDQIFKIQWPRAEKNMPLHNLGIMWKWWQHKFGDARTYQPTGVKGNFRSCLNSKVTSGEIKKCPQYASREESEDWKYFQFITRDSHSISPDNESVGTGVQDDDTAQYEPEDMYYGTSCVADEKNEVKRRDKKWIIHLKAFGPNKNVLLNYEYDYMEENEGKNKILVYVAEEDDLENVLLKTVKHLAGEKATENVKTLRIDPRGNPFLMEGTNVKDRRGNIKKRHQLLFPAFLFEVNFHFDMLITRFSGIHLYYGQQSKNGDWQKMVSCKKPEDYAENMDGFSEARQKVFGYASYIHVNKVNENIKDLRGPDHLIDPIDHKVWLVVNAKPAITESVESSPLYFMFDHRPACLRTPRLFTNNGTDRTLISEDMVRELENGMNEVRIDDDPPARVPQPGPAFPQPAPFAGPSYIERLPPFPEVSAPPPQLLNNARFYPSPRAVYEQQNQHGVIHEDPGFQGGFEDGRVADYIAAPSPIYSEISEATITDQPASPYQELYWGAAGGRTPDGRPQ